MLLDDILSQTAEVEIPIREMQGQVLKVKYYPHVITPEFQAKYGNRAEGGFTADLMAQSIVEMVCDWDMIRTKRGENGEPVVNGKGKAETEKVPIIFPVLRRIPSSVLVQIVNGVMGAISPNETPEDSSKLS